MTLLQKYGFSAVVLKPDSPIVATFFKRHQEELGYPPETQPQGRIWVGITKNDRAYCVFGAVVEPNGKLNVSDFYSWPGRLGKLASYAALEEIRLLSDHTGVPVVCMSRIENDSMNRAIERTFGGVLAHVVYVYNP